MLGKVTAQWVVAAILISTSADTALAQGNPEQGDVELSARTRLRVRRAAPDRSSGGMRLAMQGRLDAMNLVQLSRPDVGGLSGELGRSLMAPVVAPGVRLLDGRLFVGVGIGFSNHSSEAGPGEASQGGFSLVPSVTFDLLSGRDAALSLGGALTLASLSETESCVGGTCMDLDNDAFGVGMSLLAGIHAKLSPALRVGTEFGWGFMKVSTDGDDDDEFIHGLLGMLVLEASIAP